ncbi:class I SAM-dependent methyltransferase [Devosia sp. XGJD_8]|uniref:class I SAM-dependent methyltransferase n=1 Tax=Devosia sp. XGJD_8 TaxID=3391187 RepID=UPI0039850A10
MVGAQIRFGDGASYELLMGEWSRNAGADFLDWLKPPPGLAWLDVGCGSGAFSGLVVERCAPLSLLGIDPSEGQLNFARGRGLGPAATFKTGDAMQIDLPDNSVDVAIAALVLHFMPEPLRGVSEMARIVRPGGFVAAYTWDLEGGGFPYEAMHRAMLAMDFETPSPPHPEAGNADEMHRLWTAAGLENIRQRQISVSRTFRDFDHYWQVGVLSPRLASVLGDLAPDQLALLKDTTRSLVPEPVVLRASANAISGRVGG